MGKGAGRGRKPTRGGKRQFTDVETLERQNREMNRRPNRMEEFEEDAENENDGGQSRVINRQGAVGDLPPSDSEEDCDEGDTKGAAAPKPAANKTEARNKKLNELTLENLDITDPKRGLNRKEREELERQDAKKRYQALHAAGKTDEAKADLARLAIIRQQREEAAKKREAEKEAKEAAVKQRAAELAKAQGRKN